jgi:hypothetical protein
VYGHFILIAERENQHDQKDDESDEPKKQFHMHPCRCGFTKWG